MAKNEKNAAKAATKTEVTVENIEEQIMSENKMEDEIVKAAEEEIQKEKDEKKKIEYKRARAMCTYINNREYLGIRKQRKEEAAIKIALTATKEVLEKLKKGEITPREMDKELGKIAEEKNKSFTEIDNRHRELIKELKNNFPGYYSVEWEYERWSNGGSRYKWDW
jgi:NCAIR mutase (PurE)-related protein